MLEGIAPCIGVTTTAIKDTLNDSQPIPVTIEKILNEVARTTMYCLRISAGKSATQM